MYNWYAITRRFRQKRLIMTGFNPGNVEKFCTITFTAKNILCMVSPNLNYPGKSLRRIRSKYPFPVTAVFVLFMAAFQAQHPKVDPEDGLSAFSADSLKKHVAILASDEFEGRKP